MNKTCAWFGHKDRSNGTDNSHDYTNEEFVCVRCERTRNENSQALPEADPEDNYGGCVSPGRAARGGVVLPV
ncbi:hypothetical protein, partial [Pseudomonas sp. JG-B]|uniref:hypothetical protein n=1 Tax=Pseudomonas sp. JG-B TaxID=2603214 RepID=UPI001C499942